MVAVVAQWPPRPHPPHRTSPTPPPAASRPRPGRLRPRPQGGHSTTSRSSCPCGLQHLPPQRQTGHPWPPSSPLQNQGPTLPWRPRDKGGPSPLPEARTLWGGERMSLWAPFTLLCLHPRTPEPWRGETGPWCQHTGCPRTDMDAQARSTHVAWIWFRVVLVLVDRTSENKQPSPEDLLALPHPRGLWRIATAAETWLAPASELFGGQQAQSPTLGNAEPSPHVCVAVSVFICMSLSKKQPSLGGSWTLHVRVSPQAPCPPPRSPGPCLSLPPPCQPALLFPAEKRIVGNSRTLPTHSPVPACWGCLHASPRARGYLTPFQFPLLTKEKKEFKPPPGSVVLPHILSFAAGWLHVERQGTDRAQSRGHPQSCLAPHGSCLLLSFSTTTWLWNLSAHPRLFP